MIVSVRSNPGMPELRLYVSPDVAASYVSSESVRVVREPSGDYIVLASGRLPRNQDDLWPEMLTYGGTFCVVAPMPPGTPVVSRQPTDPRSYGCELASTGNCVLIESEDCDRVLNAWRTWLEELDEYLSEARKVQERRDQTLIAHTGALNALAAKVSAHTAAADTLAAKLGAFVGMWNQTGHERIGELVTAFKQHADQLRSHGNQLRQHAEALNNRRM